MTLAIQQCRDEQRRCAVELLVGSAEEHGLRQGLADWTAEELILSGDWKLDSFEVAHQITMARIDANDYQGSRDIVRLIHTVNFPAKLPAKPCRS